MRERAWLRNSSIRVLKQSGARAFVGPWATGPVGRYVNTRTCISRVQAIPRPCTETRGAPRVVCTYTSYIYLPITARFVFNLNWSTFGLAKAISFLPSFFHFELVNFGIVYVAFELRFVVWTLVFFFISFCRCRRRSTFLDSRHSRQRLCLLELQ